MPAPMQSPFEITGLRFESRPMGKAFRYAAAAALAAGISQSMWQLHVAGAQEVHEPAAIVRRPEGLVVSTRNADLLIRDTPRSSRVQQASGHARRSPDTRGASVEETAQAVSLGAQLQALLESNGYHKMPMRRMPNRYMRMTASINGRLVELLVDSGSPQTLLDPARSREAHLEIAWRKSGIGPQETEVVPDWSDARVRALEAGPVCIRNLEVRSHDLSSINRSATRVGAPPFDGVLGAHVLGKCRAILMYTEQKLYLHQVE